MSQGRSTSFSGLALAFIAGAAAGAVVALLTAPKAGREMRESVAGWARRNRMADALSRATRAARQTLDEDTD